MATFPTVEALAAATPADVLRAWAGLGYNRRALNLWRAAKVVVERHRGRLPSDVWALMALPGIGPYTARAVAAIAFGQAVGAVDTNVRRVVGRISGVASADIQSLADAIVPAARPADWTHAVMDVGATFCRSTRPRCAECPAMPWCRFASDRAADVQMECAKTRRTGSRPFRQTSRWLRGRILERLRRASGWVAFHEPIGDHETAVVRSALVTLASEGLVELDASADRTELAARLPLA
jgi:A/G-specific adenine glycosylase